MAIVSDEQVIKVLRQYNPWWRNPLAIKEENKPQKRLAYYEALRMISHKTIRRFAVLSGARRVGKTTIMYQMMNSLIDEGVIKGVLRGLFLLLNRLGADVGLEIGECVKVVVLRELVVQLGQLFKLDLVALDVEHDSLAAEIVAVVLRESNVKIALLAGGNADELALQSRERRCWSRERDSGSPPCRRRTGCRRACRRS